MMTFEDDTEGGETVEDEIMAAGESVTQQGVAQYSWQIGGIDWYDKI